MGLSVLEGKGRDSDRGVALADALIDVIYERADGMTVIAVLGALEAAKYRVLRQSEKEAE